MKIKHLLLMAIVLTSCSQKTDGTLVDVSGLLTLSSSPYSNSVNCEFAAGGDVSMSEGNITAKSWETDLAVSITGIDTDAPHLSANGGEADLLKIPGPTESTLYLAEITDAGNMNLWTLFRDTNVIILTKQYDMLAGNQYSTAMMGTCDPNEEDILSTGPTTDYTYLDSSTVETDYCYYDESQFSVDYSGQTGSYTTQFTAVLRRAPIERDCNVITTVPAGTTFTFEPLPEGFLGAMNAEDGYLWIKVTYEGQDGWIRGDYLGL